MSDSEARVCGRQGGACAGFAVAPDAPTAEVAHARGLQILQWGTAVWLPQAAAPEADGPPAGGDSGAPPSAVRPEAAVWAFYCGPLELRALEERAWVVRATRLPVQECGPALRRMLREAPPHAWTLLVSPFTWEWGRANARAVERAIALAQGSSAAVLGFPTLDSARRWRWPAATVRRQFWRLQYVDRRPHHPAAFGGCDAADTTSGTRVYRPGLLRRLASAAAEQDAASLLVELDLLALRWQPTPALTCPLPASREEGFRERAALPPALAERFQLEAAEFAAGNRHEHCLSTNGSLPWTLAHELSDRRIATRLCYRRRIEAQFCDIAAWWLALDPVSHFVSVKQGTLLTALIRGGDVSMMPWDSDLELSLYSTGANPVLGWCPRHLTWKARAQCVVERLAASLQLPCHPASDFLSSWLFEEHLSFPKFKVEVGNVFDVNFEGWVPRMPIVVRMFGRAEVRVSWEHWEHLFFEVFGGSLAKKVGTSGNIAAGVESCEGGHSACIPLCNSSSAGGSCVFEFEDHFAHTRDPYGEPFPRPWPSEDAG